MDREPVDVEDGSNSTNTIINQSVFNCLSCSESNCEKVYVCRNAIQCFEARTINVSGDEELSRGCIKNTDHQLLTCGRSNSLRRPGIFHINCCSGHYCNNGSIPELNPHKKLAFENMSKKTQIAFGLALISFLTFLVLIIYYHCKIKFKRKRPQTNRLPVDYEQNQQQSDVLLQATAAGDSTLRECFNQTFTSGSGRGFPLLVQRTLSKNIHLIECIGKGRFGEVWRGIYHGGSVAVKAFYSLDEASWKRETEMYNISLMSHVSILGYVGSDITFRDGRPQLWLVTDYHKLGSLYDHLNSFTFTLDQMFEVIISIVNGIVHLHTETFSQKHKPAVAHRDLKSKNILMRSFSSCVIADFGLAVTHKQSTGMVDIPPNPRVGTKRYMSPEILDESIDLRSIEAFKRADMYSFGFVMWEICRRTLTNDICEEYKPPFFDVVPNDPSFEDMKKIVCVDQVRPVIPDRWTNDLVLSKVSKVINECWHQDASARLTALRVQKTIRKVSNCDIET